MMDDETTGEEEMTQTSRVPGSGLLSEKVTL